MSGKVSKTDSEWQRQLTPTQYAVTRLKSTEPAFSGAYCNEKRAGSYHCVCCGQELFSSDTKYDSRTGWPSFWAPVEADRVTVERDTSHGMVRTEALCSRCDSHLGHVFDDGPRPTGQRYCMNSASLTLKPKD